MRRNSGFIGPKTNSSIEDANGVHDVFDQYNSNILDSWPITAYPTQGTITPSTTSVTEGNAVTFTVSVNNQFTGDMYYSVTGGPTDADFAENASGSFSVTNGSGTFDLTLIADGIAESDTFQVQLRRDSTSGTLFDTTASISVTDAAAPAGEDIRSVFWPISEFQNNDNSTNTTTNYSVSEVQQDYTGTARLYLAHKATGAVTYYNDAPVACIQVLNPAGTSIVEQWWFGASNAGKGWTTDTYEYNFGAIGTGLNITPATASTFSYVVSVINGAVADRFTLATSTSSVSTGAADGIAEPTGPMPLGEQTVPQSLNTYYMYRETSGAQVPFCTFCRSPIRTWTAGERIRIAYIIGNFSTANYYTPTDTFFVGIA